MIYSARQGSLFILPTHKFAADPLRDTHRAAIDESGRESH
jgi:hypothetical protein